jgi:molybdopterin synthase sulfur carrier subunit
MGFWNLKAIAVRGSKRTCVVDEEIARDSVPEGPSKGCRVRLSNMRFDCHLPRGWEDGKPTVTKTKQPNSINKPKPSFLLFYYFVHHWRSRSVESQEIGALRLLISIKVRIFATFRDILGIKETDLQFPSNITVRSLVQTLSDKYSHGKLERQVFDENGNVQKYVKILVNGRDVDFLDGPSTQLKDGDILAIFPPVAGG